MQWKPRSLVLDFFGDYLRYAGDDIRLGDLTDLLGLFGIEPSTVRVTMSRLRKEGWFSTHRIGRETAYCLTPALLEILDEGRQRIFRQRDEAWEGRWTMVIYQVPESERATREHLRKRLAWHGFGQLSPSTWLSPHDLIKDVRAFTSEYPLATIDVLKCSTDDLQQDRELAARCWDLDQLGDDYRTFVSTYQKKSAGDKGTTVDGRTALMERMEIIGDFRRFPFRDPHLPKELQPRNWPSSQAYELFGSIHRQLGPAATAYVAGVIRQPVGPGQEVST